MPLTVQDGKTGGFTLLVKATGRNQMESEVFEYAFAIRPPWWAYVLYGLMIAEAVS